MYTVAALYHFTRFDDPASLRDPLLSLCQDNGIGGTLLLAKEGINGTIAGTRSGIDAVLGHIRALPGCSTLEHKESASQVPPFNRMKVRLKKEIVTMGQPDVNPAEGTGHYVDPTDWNALITSPDVAVIDTRNDYEVAIGTFDGAIDPETKSFGEFPAWWEDNKERFHNKRIAMFCTGGIRCEKSTAYMKEQGFEEVYHLEGGILKYLEEVPEENTMWQGECFVFDERVTVDHQLQKGRYDQCNACRMPITKEEQLSEHYQHGVSCPHCFDKTTEEQKARFLEREKQIKLAEQRGEAHIGADSAKAIELHRAEKQKLKEEQRLASLKKLQA